MTDVSDVNNEQKREALRSVLQLARRQLNKAQVEEYSETIAETLLMHLEPSVKVAGYLALGNEVKLDSVLHAARLQQCLTYVPIVQAENTMVFSPINDDIPLVKNQYGILEPKLTLSDCIPASELDVVLVPLVGFDEQCQRMGMGGGYYDRAFAHKRQDKAAKPLLIGVAYEVQSTRSVLADWWDVPLDMVVTEKRTIHRP